MKTKRLAFAFAFGMSVLSIWGLPEASAGKPPRQVPAPAVQIDPVPMPNGVSPQIVVPDAGYELSGAPCCEHKCCRRHERKCKHTCGIVTCAPSIEYRGCPTPCGVTKVVSVTHPKTCMTVQVPIQIPANCCEKIDRDRDGDVELDYGKYEVSLRWRDGGRRLVVHYDD